MAAILIEVTKENEKRGDIRISRRVGTGHWQGTTHRYVLVII
jgi:hypothetical protein